jgi:serine/threonine protein kinase
LNWLSDKLVNHLRAVSDWPDLSGTKYRLLEKFAAGGMGTVYLAEDTQLQRRVALKVLHLPEVASDLSARMWREARVIAKLEHPSIVPVHDVGELPDGRVFYVMKFVQGQRLDQYANAENELPNRLRIFQKICEAVAFAHANGVIHRDLKPENIMVGAFGEVLVMDWGLAKIVDEEAKIEERGLKIGSEDSMNGTSLAVAPHETQHGTVMGTPAYMAPEQKRGEIGQIDQRADIFALGAILKFLLAGASKIPKSLAAICDQAMRENKAERYAAALDLANDIERFINGFAVSSYKENPFEILWRWIKKYQFMILLVLIYLLVRIMLFFWLRP